MYDPDMTLVYENIMDGAQCLSAALKELDSHITRCPEQDSYFSVLTEAANRCEEALEKSQDALESLG